jgi:hypothetical protein
MLLSGLIMPGLGQVALKHYKRGIVLMTAVSIAILVMVLTAVAQALAILEELSASGGPLDMAAITRAARQSAASSDQLGLNLAFLVIVTCWLIGLADAYRVGKQKDRDTSS